MYDFKVIEPDVLKFWLDNKIYEKAKEKVKKGKDYYFLDGPPYTSGKVHLGTAWNKALKDSVLRYKRMAGFKVWDRAGYDMHGLPVENKVQDKHGFKFKEEIEKYGVDKFVTECKKFAVDNMKIMNEDFKRLGVWMDFENAYTPITDNYLDGEWWLIKKAHENKRLYEGEKVMTWCPECATSLAKHELEYQNVEDTSIFLKFKVSGTENEYLIIWTTTPWTIAYNLAIMVNPELDYLKVDVEGEKWIVAAALAAPVIQAVLDKKYRVVEEFKGEQLEGFKYEHPFEDVLKDKYDAIRKKSDKVHTVILTSEYVDTSAGSGLVHSAPGCGPEDYEVCHKYGIPPFNNLDDYGNYPGDMGEFSGLNAKKDNKKFIEALDKRGALLATTPVDHEYAHCWRCHKPVVFKTTKQWFFKVEDMRDDMRKMNNDFKWIPEWAGARQFDAWLENLRDNGITRQRFWGCPLPIWRCDKCKEYEVIGSLKELKEKAGKLPKDFHIPWIDEITIKCKCGEEMKRCPDILDVWIDAGTTSWNCLDYPATEENFKRLFPADFILEGKDQIRGWFNLLFVASMVSMKKPSYKDVYMHGFIMDAQGRKMSKSLGNVISPYEVIDEYGADTLRYYMIGGALPGVDINYNFDDLKIKHKNLQILWNLQLYLINYSKELGVNPAKLKVEAFDTEELYILSKMNSTIKETTKEFDDYNLPKIPWLVEELFLELSRTYIQLIRDKAATGSADEKKVVLKTIYDVVLESLKLLAPIAPFISESIYQNLKNEFKLKEESVHLFDWPSADDKHIDTTLEMDMEITQSIVQGVLNAREKAKKSLRWPLLELVVVPNTDEAIKAVSDMEGILQKQCNVNEVIVKDKLDGVKMDIKVDSGKLGQEFKQDAPKVIAQLTAANMESIVKHIEKNNKYELKVGKEKVFLTKDHFIVEKQVPEPFVASEFRGGAAYLNVELTDELEAEGFARELMRRVQMQRKKAGMEKADEIVLYIKTDEELEPKLKVWEKQIAEKCGASKIKIDKVNPAKKYKFNSKEKVKDKEFEIFF